MYASWTDTGGGSGPVTGLTKDDLSGSGIEITRGQLVNGFDVDFYEIVAGVFTAKDQTAVDAIIAQRASDLAAAQARIDEIATAQGASGIKQYTVDEVNAYLDARFAAMTDLATVKTEMRAILDKMVPYLMG